MAGHPGGLSATMGPLPHTATIPGALPPRQPAISVPIALRPGHKKKASPHKRRGWHSPIFPKHLKTPNYLIQPDAEAGLEPATFGVMSPTRYQLRHSAPERYAL